MIQNAAMFQEVAPVATMPSGRGTASGIRPASRDGAFAKVLQGARSGEAAVEDAALKSGTPDAAGVNAQGIGLSGSAKARQLTGESDGTEAPVAKPDQAKGLEAEVLGGELRLAMPAGGAAQPGAAMVTAADATVTAVSGAATKADVLPANTAQPAAVLPDPMPRRMAEGAVAPSDEVRTVPGPLGSAAQRERVVPAHPGTAAANGQELSRLASLQAAQEPIAAPASHQVVRDPAAQGSVTTTGSNAQQESGAVAASADTVQTRPTLVWSAAQSERVVPAHAGTPADNGQEVSRLASQHAANEKNPAPLQAAQRPAAQELGIAMGNGALQQDGAAAPEARQSLATADRVPEQRTGGEVGPAEVVPLRTTTVWPAAEKERVDPAQLAAADKGQEVSRLASLRKVQDPAAETEAPAQPGTASDKGQEVSKFASLRKVQDPAAETEAPAQPGTAVDKGQEVSKLAAPRKVQDPAAETKRLDPAQPAMAANKGQEVSRLASSQKAEVKDVAPASHQAAQRPAAQDATAATESNARQDGAATPGARPSVATAGGFVPTPAPGASFQAASATPVSHAVNEAEAKPGQVASLPAVDTQEAGAPSEGDAAKVAIQGEARQTGTATGATEGAQREVPATGGKAQGQTVNGPAAQQRPVQAMNAQEAQANAAPSQEKGAQASADGKDVKSAQEAQTPRAAANVVAEQARTTEEAFGTKTASAVTAKLVPSQGNSGQDLSGDAGKQGHPGEKTQGELDGQVPPALTGAQTPEVAEAAQPETKPASHRSALHQSILSQVKDGVVSHDGKGNGQMSIRLNPGELGELKIQVRMEDNRLKIEVHAENRMVKDLLMSNLESLKEALSSKNLTMSGFDVSTGGGGFSSPFPEEKRNPRQQSMLRTARAGGYPGQEESRVNYLTGEVNNLLDVRF